MVKCSLIFKFCFRLFENGVTFLFGVGSKVRDDNGYIENITMSSISKDLR